MSTISAGIGLISGINIADLVDSLMEVQSRPLVYMQDRLKTLVSRRTALIQISAQLAAVRNAATRLSGVDFFRRAQTTSSNESVLLATASSEAALGQYTFTVRNLASTHQLISGGFATRDATPVGAGTVTIETAAALVNRATPLGALNGGAGVRAGKIRITDRAGASAEIDLRTAVTVQGVVNAINRQAQVQVVARVEGDHLVLEDQTGLQTGSLAVAEVGAGHAAEDLGLLKTHVDGVITGDDLVRLSDRTRLEELNDGNGIRVLKAQKDFRITLADGTTLDYDLSGRLSTEVRQNGDGSTTDLSTPLSVLNRGAGVPAGAIRVTNRAGTPVNIDLSAAKTIHDVSSAAGWAQANMTATVSGSHLVITDNSTGSGSTKIEDVNGTTASALGIANSSSGGTLTGEDIFFVDTIGDVVRVINAHADNADGAGGAKLLAGIASGVPGLTLTDATSGSGAFKVEALNGSRAAADLGILGHGQGNVIESRRLLGGLNTVLLRSLNGGAGVGQQLTLDTSLSALHRGAGVSPGQIRITMRDGATYDVDLSAAATIGDVKTAIESASGDLSVTLDGAHLVVTDHSVAEGETPASNLIIEDLNGGDTANRLGIAASSSSETLTGRDVDLGLGSIQLTDRSGLVATIDLAGVETLADVIAAINAAETSIAASVSASGLGITLTDTSGGAGPLIVEDLPGSTAAADLHISFNGAASTVSSGNLQRQYVSAAMRLAAFNNGSGMPAGKFRITDSSGVSAVVDLTQGNEVTLQDVIDEINSRGVGVVARVNDNGDGLLLEDTAGGVGRLTVAEEGGTTARALGILGRAEEGETFIDGSFETRIEAAAGDTLDDLLNKITESRAQVSAAIINDGTGNQPYRLSITSSASGRAGQIAVDVGAIGLSFSSLADARDAAILLGSPDAEVPLVITSSTNTLNNVIPGVRLNLVAANEEPVTVTIARNVSAVANDLSAFATAFNAAVSKIDDLTRYDAETQTASILTGDATARSARQGLINMVNRTIAGLPSNMNRLSRVGLTLTNGSSLRFDQQTFEDAFERDPESVAELFVHEVEGSGGETRITGFGGVIEDEIERLNETETGLIAIREEAIQDSQEVLTDRISQMEVLLERRRERMLAQFYAMESALAKLQAQQTALTSLTQLSQSMSSGQS